MNRYLILLILNLPFILAGLVNALVGYKLKRISKRRFLLNVVFWLLVFVGLAGAHPLYQFLFSNNFTNTESLSLFDVIQITGIVIVFFLAMRARSKTDILERRVQDLHQELSIRLSADESNKKQAKR